MKYSMYVLKFDAELLATVERVCSGAGVHAYVLNAAERERQFPKREVAAAKRARLLQERLYFTSDYALAQSIVKGTYLNCDVAPKDLQLAMDIYGFSDAIAAGKTRDLGPVASREIAVPVHMRRDQSMYADVFWWHNEPFIMAVVKPLDLVIVRHVPKGLDDAEGVGEQLRAMRSKVLSRNYHVDKIMVDGDSKLRKHEGVIPFLDVVGSGSHVAEVEVEIKVLKERCRCMEASLSVPVPRRLVPWLVYGAAVARNMVLRPGQTLCPRESFTGVKVDHDRDVRAKFFDYILATRIPDEKNSEEPRTASALYPMSTLNAKGSVYAYDLVTERVFTCDRFRIKFMPELAVAKVIELWERDEPRSRRMRKASWKLARAGRQYERPVLPPELGEGDIADVAVVPRAREPNPEPDYPIEELAPAARIFAAPPRGAASEIDHSMRGEPQEAPLGGVPNLPTLRKEVTISNPRSTPATTFTRRRMMLPKRLSRTQRRYPPGHSSDVAPGWLAAE